MAKKKNVFIALDSLVAGNNNNNRLIFPDLTDLQSSILMQGLKNRIVVAVDEEKSFPEVLRGHCRTEALRRIRTEDSKVFESLFPQGIPCVAYFGLSEKQKADIMLDQGESRPLTRQDLYLAVKRLRDAGFRFEECIEKMVPIFSITTPMKGDAVAKIEKSDNREKAIRDHYRGLTQRLWRVWSLPDFVGESLLAYLSGDSDIAIRDSDIANLEKVFKDGLADDPDCKYSLENPPECFMDLWEEIQSKKKTKKTTTKRLTTREIEDWLPECSASMQKVLKATLGQVALSKAERKRIFNRIRTLDTLIQEAKNDKAKAKTLESLGLK
jgi:hypothetical protein